MKAFFTVVAAILLVGGFALVGTIATVGLNIGSIHINGLYSKEKAKIERKVFKETTSFNEAKVQELSKHRFEYMRADGQDTKLAIESVVRIQFADYDMLKLPIELQNFVIECRGY